MQRAFSEPTFREAGGKPYIVEDLEEVLDHLERIQSTLVPRTPCGNCQVDLGLQELHLDWFIDPRTSESNYISLHYRRPFFFPNVPGYRCPACKLTYLPEEVIGFLSESLQKEIDSDDRYEIVLTSDGFRIKSWLSDPKAATA